MTEIRLPGRQADLASVLRELADGDHLDGDGPLVLHLPEETFVTLPTLAFLAAWGHRQAAAGRKVLLTGDDAYVGRMDLHSAFGQTPPPLRRHDETGRFLPIQLVRRLEDIGPVIDACGEIVLQQLENGQEFLPAIQWLLAEILENVFNHADTEQPAAICAQHYPRGRTLDLAICDVGQGLRGSLAAVRPVFSHGEAVDLAIERGISATDEAARGNGLSGTLEIARHNRATLKIWTGDVLYTWKNGMDRGFVEIPPVRGTGVSLSLDTRHPVNLEDTWIAGVVDPRLRVSVPDGGRDAGPPTLRLRVRDECFTLAAREGARLLRERVERLLDEDREVVLDFAGVDHASTSFLDELFGRLAESRGRDPFRDAVEVEGMVERIRRQADVVIDRRLQTGDGREAGT